MTYVLSFALAVAACGGWTWAVTRRTGLRLPLPDVLLIVLLCSGVTSIGWVFGTARVLGASWILGTAVLWLLVTHLTEADPWPDAAVMVTGSGVIWVVVYVTLSALPT